MHPCISTGRHSRPPMHTLQPSENSSCACPEVQIPVAGPASVFTMHKQDSFLLKIFLDIVIILKSSLYLGTTAGMSFGQRSRECCREGKTCAGQ